MIYFEISESDLTPREDFPGRSAENSDRGPDRFNPAGTIIGVIAVMEGTRRKRAVRVVSGLARSVVYQQCHLIAGKIAVREIVVPTVADASVIALLCRDVGDTVEFGEKGNVHTRVAGENLAVGNHKR